MKTIHHVFDLEQPGVGIRVHWIFNADFSPVMEVTGLDPGHDLRWRCVSGHQPWQDSDFRFALARFDDGRTRVRFWQEYAVELEDDYYGVYNYNWGYYLESLRPFCATGTGKPFNPAG